MELPDLGKHCSSGSCNRLDFLPVKCDACKKTYCCDHYKYEAHSCGSALKNDVQVPCCPLCNAPVPGKRGEAPDVAVSDHIDRDCKSDPAQAKRKVYDKRCSFSKCKQKELVPITCDQCKQNFCLKHRHFADHQCPGKLSAVREAALKRSVLAQPSGFSRAVPAKSQQQSGKGVKSVQGNYSEDEALRRALDLSRSANPPVRQSASTPQLSQEEEDEMLARAIAESEREAAAHRQTSVSAGSAGRSCSIS